MGEESLVLQHLIKQRSDINFFNCSIFNSFPEQPDRIFEMIRVEIRESVGEYLSRLMDTELTHFLGREWYEHGQGDVNHRNGSYGRNFTLKGIGGVQVEVPRDRVPVFLC